MNNLYLYSRVGEYDCDADGKAKRITTETFDKDGNLLSFARDIDADGILDSIETRTYNSNGDITSTSYDDDADGILDSIETKTYNSNGDIISESYGNGNGDLSQLMTYEYNEDGKIISKIDDSNPNAVPKILSYNTYQYDENGVLVSEVYGRNLINYLGIINENSSSQSIKTLEYDNSGKIVAIKHFLNEEIEASRTTFYSYNEDGGSSVTNSLANYSRTVGYDANGNVTSIENDLTFYGLGKDLFTREYDDSNNLISKGADYDADGIMEEVITFTHSNYSANSPPVYSEYEEYEGILNNFATRIEDSDNDGQVDAIASNTFDIHGNITSHNSDRNADGNIDYTVSFTNTYKTESADSNSEEKEILIGSNQSDFIQDFTGNSDIYGYDANDSLYGGAGNNFIDGGFGHDLLNGDRGNDSLDGGDGNDTLYGNQNRDVLYGSFGHDLLDGGYGDDTLYGGSGRDTIRGGKGSDTLSGNEDSDTFVYADALDSPLNEPDVITDFTVGSDKLLLSFFPAAIIPVNSLNEANTLFSGLSAQVAFSLTESILYVDSSAQGEADMAINLNNVTSLDLVDFV